MLISLTWALTRRLINHSCLCDAWPVQRQTYGYLPNCRSSLPATGTKLYCSVTEAHVCDRSNSGTAESRACKSNAQTIIPLGHTTIISRRSYIDAVPNWPSARMYLGDVGTAVVTASQQRLPAIVRSSVSTLWLRHTPVSSMQARCSQITNWLCLGLLTSYSNTNSFHSNSSRTELFVYEQN